MDKIQDLYIRLQILFEYVGLPKESANYFLIATGFAMLLLVYDLSSSLWKQNKVKKLEKKYLQLQEEIKRLEKKVSTNGKDLNKSDDVKPDSMFKLKRPSTKEPPDSSLF